MGERLLERAAFFLERRDGALFAAFELGTGGHDLIHERADAFDLLIEAFHLFGQLLAPLLHTMEIFRIGFDAAIIALHASETLRAALARFGDADTLLSVTQLGSCFFANKPGDGSAREQAASCQKVLGGLANICYEFATKRYRSNCINWGMLPFTLDAGTPFDYAPGDLVFVPDVRKRLEKGCEDFPAEVLRQTGEKAELLLHVKGLTPDERDILLDGCLMNYYAKRG